ncbi:hypothetical protein AaE_004782 [Aphanomyces astaci]|uniref:Uncharacterized protein n=2 Tax=Aphanomyces astaci TaxID=112090 RepID=A0A6A5A403_APHAT|nr:hypothetical protein AaE_004782 [Aphanomyces astaci]
MIAMEVDLCDDSSRTNSKSSTVIGWQNMQCIFPPTPTRNMSNQRQKLCATRCPLPPATEERVHLLPCRVKHDGKAPISSYFVVDETSNMARFRGVQLQGNAVDLHALGYSGLLVIDEGLRDESNASHAFGEPDDTSASTIWELDGHFATIVDWQTKDSQSHEPLSSRLESWSRYAAAIHDE